jgi:predicted nucleic acid-binding protein
VRRFGYPADALALAVEHGATAYDSAYVALARPLSLPLVTADEGLAGRFAEGDADVRFLGDWREGAAARS